MTKSYWHIHHELLCEPLTEPLKNRVAYIKENKPQDEQSLRLRLIKPVKGEIPPAIIEARDACHKAEVACHKAEVAYRKARFAYMDFQLANIKAQVACHKAQAACRKAKVAYRKARFAYSEAWVAYRKAVNSNRALKALHAKECLNCPWDGESIFDESTLTVP